MTDLPSSQTCSYWHGGDLCKSPVYSNNKCILHAELPESRAEYLRLQELKESEVKKKIGRKDFNFAGAIIFFVDFSEQKDIDGLDLRNATLVGGLNLSNVTLTGSTFEGATFKSETYFDRATFTEHFDSTAVSFWGATFEGGVSFYGATFERDVRFREVNFKGHASFIKATFKKEVDFSGAIVNQGATFLRATFKGDFFPFYPADVRGHICFDEDSALFSTYKATFSKPEAEEAAYRTAKQSYEALGETASADQSFYREMAARRRQKPWYVSYPELVVQYGFWYGVRPFWLLGEYAAIWFIFGAFFWFVAGGVVWSTLLASFHFSFLTIVIPGYGIMNPPASASVPLIPLAIIIETVIGVFTWPTFIVIFARKFMR